nr:hypothetical protein Itr_chr05CG24240 [Ipomoea trifida]
MFIFIFSKIWLLRSDFQNQVAQLNFLLFLFYWLWLGRGQGVGFKVLEQDKPQVEVVEGSIRCRVDFSIHTFYISASSHRIT